VGMIKFAEGKNVNWQLNLLIMWPVKNSHWYFVKYRRIDLNTPIKSGGQNKSSDIRLYLWSLIYSDKWVYKFIHLEWHFLYLLSQSPS
jgi:hypothetical protein